KELRTAQTRFEEAANIFKKSLTPEDSLTAIPLTNLARVLDDLDEGEAAKKQYADAFAIRRKDPKFKRDTPPVLVRADAKPVVVQGELSAKDPFDRVCKKSHHKVHEFDLRKGAIYILELRSAQFDTYLRLEDSGGDDINENDDISEFDL